MPTWTHEQTAVNAGTEPLAFASNVKAGSLLIAMSTGDNTAIPMAAPTDTVGTSYSSIRQASSLNSQELCWWWGIAPSAGANTVNFTGHALWDAYLVSEYSVDAGEITLDVETGQTFTGVTGTDGVTTGNVSASLDESLVVGFLTNDTGTLITYTAGTNFTERGLTNLSGSTNDKVTTESRVLATAGSVAATWTPSASAQGICFVAVFKAVAWPPTGEDNAPETLRVVASGMRF